MKPKSGNQFYLKGIRFSLGLKVIIILWAFYVAVKSDSLSVAVLYLAVSVVFVGLFIFQLRYYLDKTREKRNAGPGENRPGGPD